MKQLILIFTFLLTTGIVFNSCGPNDQKLQSNVTSALTSVKDNIYPTVKKGVVTLSGVVESDAAKAEAERIAKSVEGVKSVVNDIEVRIPEPIVNPDNTLQTTIKKSMVDNGFPGVIVEVRNGEVFLTGEIKRADLTKVMQIANETNPLKVNNNLTIK